MHLCYGRLVSLCKFQNVALELSFYANSAGAAKNTVVTSYFSLLATDVRKISISLSKILSFSLISAAFCELVWIRLMHLLRSFLIASYSCANSFSLHRPPVKVHSHRRHRTLPYVVCNSNAARRRTVAYGTVRLCYANVCK